MLLIVAGCTAMFCGAEAEKNNLPRLPGALLLLGYLRGELILTTPAGTWNLQQSDDQSAFYPSMSHNGEVIASGRVRAGTPPALVIQTYSTREKVWTDIKEIQSGGDLVISPDGGKLAIALREPRSGTPVRLHVFDRKTGEETVGPIIGRYAGSWLSWSPDGTRIAYDSNESLPAEGPQPRSGIFVLDIRTGKAARLTDGERPAWSPSGEWIAHFDDAGPDQVWLIRPDGSDKKLLVTIGKRRIGLRSVHRRFNFSPVWSPDSRTLLLNELANAETFTFDIHLLDLSTLRLDRKFKSTIPVHGWAEAK